jgi:2-dehydropantoate 2-reductase
MALERPRIAIIGTGALGGYYGARMVQAGYDVHFLLRSDYAAVKAQGMRVQSLDGDFSLQPEQLHVYDDVRSMPRADLVLITLKATANDALDQLIPPLLKHDTVLLTMQNGLGNEALLAAKFGKQRVMGGLAFVCINRLGPGLIHHMDHGMVQIGEFEGPPRERTREISRIFSASKVHCQVLQSLLYGRWLKLVWNIPFNGLGAVLDLTTDRLIDNEPGIRLVSELMGEVIAVGMAQGLQFPADLIEQQIERTRSMGAYRSSMQVDRQEGRPLEVEAILQRPLETARSLGISTPRLSNLCDMACVVDRSARK